MSAPRDRASIPSGPPIGSASQAMSLLAVRSRRILLAALARGTTRPVKLERATGLSSSTVRRDLRCFEEMGLVSKRRLGGTERGVEHPLTQRGRDMMVVLVAAGRWLERRPAGALAIKAEESTKPLVSLRDGWSYGLLQSLARIALTQPQLEVVIPASHYVIGERLGNLVRDGLLEASPDGSGRRRHALTGWGRLAIGPLALAGLWQYRHLDSGGEAATVADAIPAMMIAAPLVRLPEHLGGICELTVHPDAERGAGDGPASVHIAVERGRVVAWAEAEAPRCDATASAPVAGWFAAVVEDETTALRFGGEKPGIAIEIVRSLHHQLYRATGTPDLHVNPG